LINRVVGAVITRHCRARAAVATSIRRNLPPTNGKQVRLPEVTADT